MKHYFPYLGCKNKREFNHSTDETYLRLQIHSLELKKNKITSSANRYSIFEVT